MGALAIFQIVAVVVSLAVSIYTAVNANKKNNSTTNNFEAPTADEGKPFGMCVGLTRCKANTLYFKMSRSTEVKSGGK